MQAPGRFSFVCVGIESIIIDKRRSSGSGRKRPNQGEQRLEAKQKNPELTETLAERRAHVVLYLCDRVTRVE